MMEIKGTEHIKPVDCRAVHIDLKGMPPRFERLLDLLNLYAAAGYNALLIEWEDMFPWKNRKLRRAETYSEEQIGILGRYAAARNLEIIPLVQTYGHMENVLKEEQFIPYRELEWLNSDLTPSVETRQLVIGMFAEILALLPDVRRFHIGGDEVGSLGLGKSAGIKSDEQGKAELYFSHMSALASYLEAHNVRALLWHDMIAGTSRDILKKYAALFDVVYWGYRVDTAIVSRFLSEGCTVWGAPCFKGADSITSDLPNLVSRKKNMENYVTAREEIPFSGLIACGWSRYTTLRSQCDPVEGALDSAVAGGMYFSGIIPSREQVIECLAINGFQKDHTRSVQLLKRLAELRQLGKRYFWDALELAASQQRLGCVGDSKMAWYCLMERKQLQKLEELKKEFHAHFDQFTSEELVEDYLEERITPFRRGLELMESDNRKYGHPEAENGYRDFFGIE
jgi:hypothetical protein